MRDITHKISTLRIANASATLRMDPESVEMVKTNTGPKPDMPATARAAGYLAVKNTAGAIPHCHPIPVEKVKIDFEYGEETIQILVEVQSIYRTGCEMEALHGASIAALTIYDMLKPVDKEVEIEKIVLLKKTGGKSDFKDHFKTRRKAAILICSDLVVSGKKDNSAGKVIREKLESVNVFVEKEIFCSDSKEEIELNAKRLLTEGYDLVITAGGTGIGPRDQAPDVIRPMLDKEIPGVMEMARNYGLERTPYAMMSRSIAGVKGNTLVLCLPGSTNGARESMDALFPPVLHICKVLQKLQEEAQNQ